MQKELHLFNINGLDCNGTKRGLSLYIEVSVSKCRLLGSSKTIGIATGDIFKALSLLLGP
jgi:hypothetical protein